MTITERIEAAAEVIHREICSEHWDDREECGNQCEKAAIAALDAADGANQTRGGESS